MDVVDAALRLTLGVAVLSLAVVGGAELLVRSAAWVRRRSQDSPELVLRRCDHCQRAWRGSPRTDYGLLTLVLRRELRRRLRGTAVSTTATTRAWSRCPSCLSRRVRNSGEPPAPVERWSWLEGVGLVALLAGSLLVSLAVLAAVTA